jgi:hypothetical protein
MRHRWVGHLVEPLRRYPATGPVTAGEAIEEDRAER